MSTECLVHNKHMMLPAFKINDISLHRSVTSKFRFWSHFVANQILFHTVKSYGLFWENNKCIQYRNFVDFYGLVQSNSSLWQVLYLLQALLWAKTRFTNNRDLWWQTVWKSSKVHLKTGFKIIHSLHWESFFQRWTKVKILWGIEKNWKQSAFMHT